MASIIRAFRIGSAVIRMSPRKTAEEPVAVAADVPDVAGFVDVDGAAVDGIADVDGTADVAGAAGVPVVFLSV